MKKYIILFLVLLISSCKSKNDITPALYEVQTSKGKVYLFPSIHLADKSIYPFPDYVMNSYNGSDLIGFEYDLESQQTKTSANSTSPNIKLLISDTTYNLLEKYAKETNVGLRFTVNKDAIEIARYIFDTELRWNNILGDLSIETYLYNLAKDDKKQIVSLEDNSSVQLISDTLTVKQKESVLKAVLEKRKGLSTIARKAINLWKKGEIELIHELNTKLSFNIPSYEEKLVSIRNVNMVSDIESYLTKRKVYFISIGAAHFAGEKGILKLLEGKGYKIRNINKA